MKEDWAIGKIGLVKSEKCPDFVMLESALEGDCRVYFAVMNSTHTFVTQTFGLHLHNNVLFHFQIVFNQIVPHADGNILKMICVHTRPQETPEMRWYTCHPVVGAVMFMMD